jgi:fatty-acyl-CoA synthase
MTATTGIEGTSGIEGVGSWPARWAASAPDACAIRWDGADITWRQLEHGVASAANALADMGVGRGDRVGCLMTNCPEFLLAVFATVRLGALFVPLNTRLAAPELAYIAEDAGVSVLVTEASFDAVVTAAGLDAPRMMREHWPTGDGRPSPESPTTWDDDAFICYTSGTTGRPKGAVLTHRGVFFTSIDQVLAHGISHADRMYAPLPLCFTGGLVNVAMTMAHTGGTLVLEAQFEPGRALRQIEQERITLFFAVPYLFDTMRQHSEWEQRDLTSMRVAKTGGAPVPEALLEAYAERGMLLTQGFGLTEGGGLSLNLSEHDVRRKLGSAGLPVFYGDAEIADDAGNSVPAGTVGELCVRGPQVMRAYWNNPVATADALRDGWLHTGDLAVRDEEGYFTIVDRKKDMVITGGLNVYPAEVEAVLTRDAGVAEVAVLGVPSSKWGEEVVAVVVSSDCAGAEERLRRMCAEQLADYKRPRRFYFRDQPLPRTVSGKVLKRELRETLRTEGAPAE